MGKVKEGRTKFVDKNKHTNVQKSGTRNQTKFKGNKSKQEKSKPPRQNKVAELIEQKKQVKLEKERKAEQYKKKRLEKTKVISKKTSRGQPLMKNRIEYLLKQIEEMKRS